MSQLITEPTKRTVEDMVNTVSYKVDPNYIPSAFALEYINFMKMITTEQEEENLTPVLHYQMLDQVGGKKKRIANMLFRGSAKTTIFDEIMILYVAVYGEIQGFGDISYCIYVSDSIENGVKKMRLRLQRRWENSSFLQKYVPTTRFTDIRWYFKNIDGKESVTTGHGAQTGVRGTVELGTRPQLALLDDLMSDEDARSDTVIASVEDTVYKAINYALHPTKSKIIWNGTPFNAKDPLYKAVESGAWNTNVFPVCESFPCTKEEFRGAWEDRFPYEYVKEQYDAAIKLGKISTFNQELMLRIMSEEERLILDCDIQWYKFATVREHLASFNKYITTDFATSENSSADFSVISVWALNHNGDWFWIDGIVKKQLMDKNIDDLFRLVHTYTPLEVGIEVSGQQSGFIPWIQDQMVIRNNYFNLASEGNNGKPGLRPNTNKMQRFNIVVPWFKAKKMYFPVEKKESPELQEAIAELSLATLSSFKSKHDDFIDTISQLALLKSWRPSSPETILTKLIGGSVDLWEMEDKKEIDRMGSYIV